MTLLLLSPLALAATTDTSCLPMGTWADRARDDLIAGEFDTVRDDLQKANATLDCRVASRTEIARYWLYSGALAALTGEDDAADRAFATAHRLDPAGWDPALGDALHAAYDTARPGSPVTVDVDTNRAHTLLDGEPVRDWPTTVPAGHVAIQVLGHARGEVYGHALLDVPASTLPVTLATGLPELPPLDRSAQHRKAAPWLVGSLVSLAGSGGVAFYTLTQREAAGTAPTIDEATTHHDRQMVGAWSTAGLAGVGTVLLTVGAITW